MVGVRRKIIGWMTLLTLVLSACTTPTVTSTTDAQNPTTVSSSPSVSDPELAAALPTDPDVIKGILPNGLTYFIRENDSPGGRAELRLLVDAGSVQEDDDQAGMAHFLEHMMFNGTDRFPRNELIDVLEAFGPRFGPDINARTSFDETVYELSLSTDDEGLVELGLDVLREWATRATLTETDVIEERGVILDEWRLRAQGFGARVGEQVQELLLSRTPYENRLPIGTADSISSTSSEALGRFYSDWYVPQRMAVVAVGDFDASEMQDLIVDKFGDIESVDQPREFEDPVIVPLDSLVARRFLDEEATTASASILWRVPFDSVASVGDYQRSIALSLGLEVISDRLNEEALSSGSPLLGVAPVDQAWTQVLGIVGVDSELRVETAREGVEIVLEELERVRRHGLTDSEFDRALLRFGAASKQRRDQQESIQDGQIAEQITSHFLSRAPLMSPDQAFDVELGIAGRMEKSDIEDALSELLDEEPAILVVGPDEKEDSIPNEAEIVTLVNTVSQGDIPALDDDEGSVLSLMDRPEPTDPEDVEVDSRFGFTTVVYPNGATVKIWESDIAAESVFTLVEGFGGSSLASVEDLPEAQLAVDIVNRSGVAEFDVPALQRALSDKIVSAEPWVSESRHGIQGFSSTGDVETLLQLVHLLMTEPRFDQSAVDAVLDELEALNASRDDLPDLLFTQALVDSYYSGDPRYWVVPSSEQLAEFDPGATEQFYRDRFGDAGDLVFVLVGDFEADDMVELASRYIGTLPGTPGKSAFVDNQPLPPREVQVTTVEAGAGDQGQIGMFFTNEFRPELRDRVAARLVELILTARLRDRVREELSATYSIFASIDLQRDPDEFAETSIVSSGDPEGLDQIGVEILAQVTDLQQNGPTADEFATAVEQLRDELELIDNGSIAEALVTSFLYPDQPVDEIADRFFLIDEITREEVQELARIVFNLGQRIEIRQVPRP